MITSGQAIAKNGHYLVVNTFEETDLVCDYIINGGDKGALLQRFDGCYWKDLTQTPICVQSAWPIKPP